MSTDTSQAAPLDGGGPATTLLRNGAVAAAYFIVGRLALLMADPQGYATAVWPAAGLAVVAVLVWGRRVAPGVVLGSFFVNLVTSYDASSASALAQSLAVATSIAVGIGLHAALAAGLVRRYAAMPGPCDQTRDIVRFLALAGPVACIVSATWGIGTLLVAGLIPPAEAPFSWWTWWVGDAIGVVLFAPLLLSFVGRPRETWRPRRGTVALPLVLGFALVAVLFVRASSWEQERMYAAQARRATQLANALQSRLERHIDAVEAIAGLYGASEEVTRREFHSFVTPVLERHPGIRAMSWNPRTSHAERAALEARARDEGLAGYSIWAPLPDGERVPSAVRGDHYPVFFVEPRAGNERALGYDGATDATRRETIERARDTGKTLATPPIALAQEPGAPLGFVVTTPIYRGPTPPRSEAERRAAFIGIVVGVFWAPDMVNAALTESERGDVEVALYDASPSEGDRILYREREPSPAAELLGTTTWEVAGRSWRLELRPTPELAARERSWQAWLVLAGGLAIIALLGTMLLIITGRESRRAEAEARYRDLYERAPDMYVSVARDGTITECNEAVVTSLGYPKAELIGRSVVDLYDPESQEAARATLAAANDVREVELRLARKGAPPIDVSLSMTTARGDGGAVTGHRCVWRDNSHRKEAERDVGFLFDLGERLRVLDEPGQVVGEVVTRLGRYLEVSRCVFAEIDVGADRVTVHREYRGESLPPHIGLVLPLSGFADETTRELMAGRTVVIADLSADPRTAERYAVAYEPLEMRAFLGVPLMRGGEWVATLSASTPVPRAWTGREQWLLQTLAERTWSLLENMRMLKALRDSERRFRRIVETTHDGIWQIDAGAKTEFVNDAMARMLGYSVAEMMERPFHAFMDQEFRAIAERNFERRRQGISESHDFRFLRKDGTSLWTHLASSPLSDDDGRYTGAVAVVADITERVRLVSELRELSHDLENRVEERTHELRAATDKMSVQEARFRTLFDESPVALWEEDFSEVRAYFDELRAAGVDVARHLESHPEAVMQAVARIRVIAVNQASIEMYEARSADELLAGIATSTFVLESFTTMREELCALLRGATHFECETVTQTLRGKKKTISLRLTLIPGCEESWARVVVSIFDLSLHKESERLIRASLAEKEVLLKEIHHRVKNNLQVISSLLNLQAHHLDDDRARAMLAESQGRVQSIALVHEKLYQSPDLAHIDFEGYLRVLVETLLSTHDAAARGITARVRAGAVKLPVNAAIPCGLIVNELVTNALKHAFIGRGAGEIEITLEANGRYGPEGHGLHLLIADDGVGLPTGLDPKVASSLGLDLVATFAEQLEADLEVRRESGTAFHFWFAQGS